MITKIQIPTECPCCGSALEFVGPQLYCRNLSCDAQVAKKIENMAKVLQIKGLGPKTIEKLELNDITEVFYLDISTVTKQLGSEKTATKLLDEIERSKQADLATVLAAMSIPLIGNTLATKISKVVSHISEINFDKCKEAGLGDKATAYLLDWLKTEFTELKDFLPFSFNSSNILVSNTDGDSICITGKLSSFKTKSEAYKILEDAGYRIVESVTKTTKFLVDEEGKASTKRKKAESLGITIIPNLNEFINSKEN